MSIGKTADEIGLKKRTVQRYIERARENWMCICWGIALRCKVHGIKRYDGRTASTKVNAA